MMYILTEKYPYELTEEQLNSVMGIEESKENEQ